MVTKEEREDYDIRLLIDGEWTAEDMAYELGAIDYAYNIEVILQRHALALQPGAVYNRADLLSPKSPFREAIIKYFTDARWTPALSAAVPQRCRVRRVRYGSEGIQDLLGIGKSLEVVADLIKFFSEYPQRYRRQVAETDLIREQTKTTRLQQDGIALDNMNKALDFMDKARFSAKQKRKATQKLIERYDVLDRLVDEGKIKAVIKRPKG
jgi:hypothetical protein